MTTHFADPLLLHGPVDIAMTNLPNPTLSVTFVLPASIDKFRDCTRDTLTSHLTPLTFSYALTAPCMPHLTSIAAAPLRRWPPT